jgi:hypothetical protein
VTLTVFRDRHVYVEGVGASSTPGGFAFQGLARLR